MGKIMASEKKEVSKREITNQNLVRSMAPEGAVLLENRGGLPLKKTVSKIALYGNGARRTVKGGIGSGDVNSRHVVTIEEGLENAGYEITTKQWLEQYDLASEKVYQERIQTMREKLANNVHFIDVLFGTPEVEATVQQITKEDIENSDTDTAIYVIARKSGEGADRKDVTGDFQISDAELSNITYLGKMYKDVIVLLNVGGPIQVEPLKTIPGISAILLVSQSGNVIGDIVADIIRGISYPSGKLTATWAKEYKDYPYSLEFSSTGGNYDDSFYKEGIFVGYRYFDTFGIEPSYCFGYGIGYTEFDVKVVKVDTEQNKVKIECSVENIGKEHAGKEVVQVYYSAPDGDLEKPYQELVTFAKSKELQPGEKTTIQLTFPMEKMASFSEEKAAWILEKGCYMIRVGTSSRDTKIACKLELKETVIVEQLQRLFQKDVEFQEMRHQTAQTMDQDTYELRNVPIFFMDDALHDVQKSVVYQKERMPMKTDCSDLITIQDVLEHRRSLEELVAQLTVEEMIQLCVGSGYMNQMTGSAVIGAAAITVPGAAGETSSHLYEQRGIPNIVLADGPAGLRLLSEFSIDKEENILQGGIAIPLFEDLFGKRPEEKKPEPYKTYYQYCTAIPIATMLAQTWNEAVIQKCGDIIGGEMEEFGVTLWLAPGMNIQRNPLCGRNFEYYSEDPVLSGVCATAETKGVQSHRGVGVTLKHFACNNQEENREFCNSHVSERALREIYLKGFETCVKDADPMSIMTSYNLLNGVHTANHKNLLMSCLRDEWKFEGAVMTDWSTTTNRYMVDGKNTKKYDSSAPDLCIAAGNDLIMPGTNEDIVGIRNGYENGSLELAQIQFCARNVLKLVIKSME